jgi:hypothetical protein
VAAYQTVDTHATVPDEVTTYQLGYLNLDVGLTYRFAVSIQRIGGTGDVRVHCTNRLQIANRNGDGTTQPYVETNLDTLRERTGRAAIPPVH